MNKEQLNENISARLAEVAGYQANIDNYTRMIAKIPGEWCAETAALRGLDTLQMVAQCVDDAILQRAGDLNFRDRLTATVRAERLEQRKAALVLDVLRDQLAEVEK